MVVRQRGSKALPDRFSLALGDRLRMARQMHGLGLRALRERLAAVGAPYSLSALAQFERGEIDVSTRLLLEWCSVVGMTPQRLLARNWKSTLKEAAKLRGVSDTVLVRAR